MTQDQTRNPPTVTLLVRSLAPDGAEARQRAVIERLERLDADGHIEGFVVIVWGKKYCPETADSTETGRLAQRFLGDFDEWSARTGLSTAPFFEVQTNYSAITDESKTAIVYPLLALAEYDGTDLSHVSPCRTTGAVCTVEDHLDAITDGERRAPGTADSPSGQPAGLGAKLAEAAPESVRWQDPTES
jgi:DNA-binding Lrp family transcriptional regulator